MIHIKRLVLFLWCSLYIISALAQEETPYKISIPQKGEGLYAFLSRNNLNPDKFTQQFLNLNKGKFGKNNALLLGVKYKIPATESYLFEPLYGKEREKFKVESNDLSGAVYHLVSGHGGPDPGALGKYGDKTLAEDEYAYDITLRLAKKLQENGATVNMIIQDTNDGIRDESYLEMDKDEICNEEIIPLEQIDRLKQRTKVINQLYIKISLRINVVLLFMLIPEAKEKPLTFSFIIHQKVNPEKKQPKNWLRSLMRNTTNINLPEVIPELYLLVISIYYEKPTLLLFLLNWAIFVIIEINNVSSLKIIDKP